MYVHGRICDFKFGKYFGCISELGVVEKNIMSFISGVATVSKIVFVLVIKAYFRRGKFIFTHIF